jgi:hypothetical protein
MIIYLALFTAIAKEIYRHYYPINYELFVTNIRSTSSQIIVVLEPRIITIGYNIIYFYSLYQLYFNKFLSVVTPYLNIIWSSILTILKQSNLICNNERLNNPTKIISFYKNGNELDKIVYNDINNKMEGLNYFIDELADEKNYDFLILSDKKENSDCVNKVHYTECPETTEYINSNIKFLSMQLSYNNNSYPIELKNDNHDHYIVNNILNKDFFKYYLINVLNVEITDEPFDYSVSVIDHNVNIIEMNSTSQLVIKETDYDFITNNKNDDNLANLDTSTNSDNSDTSTNSDNSDTSTNSYNLDNSDTSTNSDKYVNLEVPN